ncbi:hypothetical protein ALSL_2324 [Aerosticca soli]|uniref:Uncharacterized protein n=1 Tax=Aerosticca soli TaxID=2010829 RepID=A0A2Z6E8S1_9GAMM|nr:hypothetical protein ALSL_2324 [Aerosticca soli]
MDVHAGQPSRHMRRFPLENPCAAPHGRHGGVRPTAQADLLSCASDVRHAASSLLASPRPPFH